MSILFRGIGVSPDVVGRVRPSVALLKVSFDTGVTVGMGRQWAQDAVEQALCDYKDVTYVSSSVARWSGKQLESILERTATYMADVLMGMSESDPYYDVTHEAYLRIPDDVGNNQLELFKVVGGPGCGKTTVIKKICDTVDNCTVMVPFKRLQADYLTERCYTQHNCVVKEMTTNLLLVDEFTGCDVGMVCAAAINQGCSRIILWGDVLQTWLQDSEGVGFKDYKIPTFVKLKGNFRNPKKDTELLNSVFDDDMVSKKEDQAETIIVRELFGDNVDDEGANLTFSRDSVDELKNQYFISAITVRSSQGATYERVNLFVFQRDLNMFTNPPLFRVACSRHKCKLVIYTCHTASAALVLKTGKLTNDHLVGLDSHELADKKGILTTLIKLIGF